MTAPFRILRAAYPVTKAQAQADAEKGIEVFRKVVNISSTSALNGNAGQINYSGAKAGLTGMTRALSREWGRFKVNVNCVAFGLIHHGPDGRCSGRAAVVQIEALSPPPASRELIHTREVVCRGYRRSEGLFDIESSMKDISAQGTEMSFKSLEPGELIHGMRVNLTVDAELVIRDIQVDTDASPLGVLC